MKVLLKECIAGDPLPGKRLVVEDLTVSTETV